MQFKDIIFWSYDILLLIGGLIGFFKSGSKASLITSAVAAALLILTRLPGVFQPSFGRGLANVIMAALIVIFAWRLTKTKKFMPNGLMMILTVVVLFLLNFGKTW
ncbi:MAG TPA: TMEM14 family protein [Candidatus Sulfotelmatobacter sp.]|nr:TMEM14 family protein [Candidatus Sulfotelmatobacter sp.]